MFNRQRFTRNPRRLALTDAGWPMTNRSYSLAGTLRDCTGADSGRTGSTRFRSSYSFPWGRQRSGHTAERRSNTMPVLTPGTRAALKSQKNKFAGLQCAHLDDQRQALQGGLERCQCPSHTPAMTWSRVGSGGGKWRREMEAGSGGGKLRWEVEVGSGGPQQGTRGSQGPPTTKRYTSGGLDAVIWWQCPPGEGGDCLPPRAQKRRCPHSVSHSYRRFSDAIFAVKNVTSRGWSDTISHLRGGGFGVGIISWECSSGAPFVHTTHTLWLGMRHYCPFGAPSPNCWSKGIPPRWRLSFVR